MRSARFKQQQIFQNNYKADLRNNLVLKWCKNSEDIINIDLPCDDETQVFWAVKLLVVVAHLEINLIATLEIKLMKPRVCLCILISYWTDYGRYTFQNLIYNTLK